MAMGLIPGFGGMATGGLMEQLSRYGLGRPGPIGGPQGRGSALFARPGISLKPTWAQPMQTRLRLSPFQGLFQGAEAGGDVPTGKRVPEVTKRPFSFETARGRGELMPGQTPTGQVERGILNLNPGILRALLTNPNFRLPSGMRLNAQAQQVLAAAPQLIAQYQGFARDGQGRAVPITAEHAAILAAAGLDTNLVGNPNDPANPFQFVVEGPQAQVEGPGSAITPGPVGAAIVPPAAPTGSVPVGGPPVPTGQAEAPAAPTPPSPEATAAAVTAPTNEAAAAAAEAEGTGTNAPTAATAEAAAAAAEAEGTATNAPTAAVAEAAAATAEAGPSPDAPGPDAPGDSGGGPTSGDYHHGSVVPKEGWYFLEDGEFVLNRDAYDRMKPLIDEINKIGKGSGEATIARIQEAAAQVAESLRKVNLEASAPLGAGRPEPGSAAVGFLGGPMDDLDVDEDVQNGGTRNQRPMDVERMPFQRGRSLGVERLPLKETIPPGEAPTLRESPSMMPPPVSVPMGGAPLRGPSQDPTQAMNPPAGATGEPAGIVPPWLQKVGQGETGPMMEEIGKHELETNLPAMTSTKMPPLGQNAYADQTGRLTFNRKNPDPSTWMRLETSRIIVRSLLDSGEANRERPLLVPPGTLDLPPRARGRVIADAYKSQYASTRPMLNERVDELGLPNIGREVMQRGLPPPPVGAQIMSQ